MHQIEREKLRVWDDARRTLAQRLDPDDTLTVDEAIIGHDMQLAELYSALLDSDAVLQAMRGRRNEEPPELRGIAMDKAVRVMRVLDVWEPGCSAKDMRHVIRRLRAALTEMEGTIRD